MNSGPILPEIRTAAQQWFAKLQALPEGDNAEREAFERWRTADPAHAAAWRAVESVWQRSAAIERDPALDIVLRRARTLPPERPFFRRTWPVLATAASLMLAVGIGYRVWWMPENIPAIEYATQRGEQRTIALTDGSTLVLDTASTVQVQYGKRQRTLTLQRGQADFQVRHEDAQGEAGRPFVVHAAGVTITATGTRFQVRLAENASTVTLLEGQVIVAPEGDARDQPQQMLDTGERIAIRTDGTLGALERLAEPELASARGWTQGSLVVREWPLSQLLAEMNRYTATPYRLADNSLADLRISGSFQPADQRSFLLALEYGWPIHADRTAGEILLRRK